MRRARALPLVLLALCGLAAPGAQARRTPILSVGGFSSQVSARSASVGALISAGSSAAPSARPSPPLPPPPPTLPADAPQLANPAPDGPGSLWYAGAAGEECIYLPAASPACYVLVSPAAPAIDVPALAQRLAAALSLSLAPIAASPGAADAGLAGVESWFWLAPPPAPHELTLTLAGETITVSAAPGPVAWDFGDGASATAGPGVPFAAGAVPTGAVTHVFETRCLPGDRGADPYVLGGCGADGYPVSASVRWTIDYRARGPLTASGELSPRTTLAALAYPVSEVRAFLVGAAG